MNNKLVDATLFLAITTGILYLLGYIYDAFYLSYFGLSTSQFLLDPQKLVLIGFLVVIESYEYLMSFVIIIFLHQIIINGTHKYVKFINFYYPLAGVKNAYLILLMITMAHMMPWWLL